MSSSKLLSNLISVDWLYKNLEADNLVVLDATIPKVSGTLDDYTNKLIPRSQFFDIKGSFSDSNAEFPNTLPSKAQFQSEVRKLGINRGTAIVVYDAHGLYSSARAWWLFKHFGHHNIAVLDGGLPKWLSRGFSTSSQYKSTTTNGDFVADDSERLFIHYDSINAYSKSLDHLIIDARSAKRFNGEVPEPRQGLRSGTLPNSINIPYTELLNNGCFKSKTALLDIFESKIDMQNTLVFSCGSGITACNLALGASIAGYHNLLVYDGSWTEYGSLTKS